MTFGGDTDVIDVVTPSGLAFLVWGSAVKALSKAKNDVTLAMNERNRLAAQLNEWATYRAMNDRPRIYVEDREYDSYRFREGSYQFDR